MLEGQCILILEVQSMSEAMGFTVSSQLKSANAVSDVANHSGKANRAKLKHANPEVDTSLSHLNVELDFFKREELLEDHYREKIDKHNKNNNSASRRWDTMEDFLATFEGRKVKHKGEETKNEEWSTSCQISYFGNHESWEALRGVLSASGVSDAEIRKTYAEAYEGYVRAHNEHFKTLPIYHSDIHFDETTPHGHDAIVVKGHTATGKPSHSLNNALAEHYGFPTKPDGKKRPPTFSEKTENMRRYRDDNDGLMFDSMAEHFGELARSRGIEIEFEPVRTGQETSHEYHVYKAVKDRESDLDEREMRLKAKSKVNQEKSSKLKLQELEIQKREEALAEQQKQIEEQRSAQQIASAEILERTKKLNEWQESLMAQQNKIDSLRKTERKNGFGVARMIANEESIQSVSPEVAENFYHVFMERRTTEKTNPITGTKEKWTIRDHLSTAKHRAKEAEKPATQQVAERDAGMER